MEKLPVKGILFLGFRRTESITGTVYGNFPEKGIPFFEFCSIDPLSGWQQAKEAFSRFAKISSLDFCFYSRLHLQET